MPRGRRRREATPPRVLRNRRPQVQEPAVPQRHERRNLRGQGPQVLEPAAPQRQERRNPRIQGPQVQEPAAPQQEEPQRQEALEGSPRAQGDRRSTGRGQKRTHETLEEDALDDRVRQSNSDNQIQKTSPKCGLGTPSGSGIPMECLRSRARTLLQTAIAPNSHLTYSNAINAFEKFRSVYHLRSQWPAPVQDVVLFIAYSFEKGQSPKTISTYVAGLNYFHKLHGFYDLLSVFIISKLLEGCRRNRPTRDNRAPLTKDKLITVGNVLPTICYTDYEPNYFLLYLLQLIL
ncbi:uncharacterized protein LOC123530881, partial [Mercenaria mercenaria]|uniref:uncharacterized protein LOC123530881 n=1 Tax=Mercenaria mercenaria TaxID=6596 RepID=UPI00234EEB42